MEDGYMYLAGKYTMKRTNGHTSPFQGACTPQNSNESS